MIVSKKWLQQFVDIENIDPQEIADRLIFHSAEVEGFWRQDEFIKGVVVGLVKSAKKHPDADRLQLCKVFDGSKTHQVVCGGSNVREGMKCAFAPVGSRVKWHGEDEVVLEPVKIRGKKSEGMICAAEELGLAVGTELEKEIMDLSHLDYEAGTPLAKALEADDLFFDIDNKSINNRPDMWGHMGVARELSAIFDKKFEVPEPPAVSSGQPWSLKVDISAPAKCRRYQAVVVENVAVRPSPGWMQRRLKACGIKAINNVVDITNWVQLELGQPMHAFDVDRLTAGQDAATVKVREARKSESIVALDDEKYNLEQGMLVIADERQPIAIAGVMGGKDSGVTNKTETILFEAANFDAKSTRITSGRLGVRTESSARFEKTLDPALTSLAIRRALQLLLVLSPDARVASPVADAGMWKIPRAHIDLSTDRVNSVLGIEIKPAKIKSLLEHLGFVVSGRGKTLKVEVPSWRATRDVLTAEDLIEEVGRMWGYDKIVPSLPNMEIAAPSKEPARVLSGSLREVLCGSLAYSELLSYSFAHERMHTLLGGNVDDLIEMENPLSADAKYLRDSLVPGVLAHVEHELHQRDQVSVFEIGTVFDSEKKELAISHGSDHKLPLQQKHLVCAFAQKKNSKPFYEMRRILDQLSGDFELEKSTGAHRWVHPGRSAEVLYKGEKVGWVAELHPTAGAHIGITQRVAMLELNVSVLSKRWQKSTSYTKLSEFPAVERDLALLLDKDVEYRLVESTIKEACDFVSHLELFDRYQGAKIDSGKKSLAFHMRFSHPEKTLTSEEVNEQLQTITRALKKKTGARVR